MTLETETSSLIRLLRKEGKLGHLRLCSEDLLTQTENVEAVLLSRGYEALQEGRGTRRTRAWMETSNDT